MTNPTATNPPPATPKVAVTGTHAGPMDLSAGAGTGRISFREKARRIAEGLCFRCGGTGHLSRDCPNRPRQLNASGAAVTTTVPSEEPSTANDEESGKE